MFILNMPVMLGVAPLVVIPIVIAALALIVGGATLINTKINDSETNKVIYSRLYGQMKLQCRSKGFQVNTPDCSVWLMPVFGDGLKTFYFYSSVDACDPKKTIYITFLDDGESIEIGNNGEPVKTYQARFLALEVDKLLAGQQCMTSSYLNNPISSSAMVAPTNSSERTSGLSKL
jgi:hypothetical protein